MSGNDEEPMDTSSQDSEMQQPSTTFDGDELVAGFQGTSINTQMNTDDAVDAVDAVDVFVKWPENDRPQKYKTELEKALQSWCNKNTNMANCFVVSASEDGGAQIRITPASALDELLSLGEKQLTYRDQKVTIHKFTPRVSKPVSKPVSNQIPDSNPVTSPLPSTTLDVDIQEEKQGTAAATAGQEAESCTVPPALFWYVQQAYKEKMKRIEKDNGVKIVADVKVSFEADPKAGGNPNNAVLEFTNLVQSCLADASSFTFSLSGCFKYTDKEDWKNALKYVQRDESKLVLTVSSEEMTVQGPRMSRDVFCKSLNIPQKTQTMANASIGASTRRSQDASHKIGIDVKDPLVGSGLTMDEINWKVMTTVFDKKIAEIQAKFGVTFVASNISQGKVNVTATANGLGAGLLSHAVRALLHLYQKVATSTISCSLLFPQKAKEVEDRLGEIRSHLPGIEAEEKRGAWRLTGLPENLGRAVYELEKAMGGPVFKEEDKQRIGYSRHTMSNVGPAMEGGATAGGAVGENEEEKCPICMDTFTDKAKLNCTHEFCRECLAQAVKSLGPICPVCKAVFGKIEGDQPDGNMTWSHVPGQLPGFSCGTLMITYSIQSGRQSERHPHPGKHFYGIERRAYLPDNQEGREVVKLLKRAFDQKLIFTVGTSRTTGADDQVTWNDIHHKTSMYGGPESYGYPDPAYLNRVKEELKAKGIE